jgi:hypothetical protein
MHQAGLGSLSSARLARPIDAGKANTQSGVSDDHQDFCPPRIDQARLAMRHEQAGKWGNMQCSRVAGATRPRRLYMLPEGTTTTVRTFFTRYDTTHACSSCYCMYLSFVSRLPTYAGQTKRKRNFPFSFTHLPKSSRYIQYIVLILYNPSLRKHTGVVHLGLV